MPKFDRAEFDQRLARVQRTLSDTGIDLAVITTPENICYLVGHETPGYYTYQCLLVPRRGAPVLLVRETEVVNGLETTWLDTIVGYHDAEDPIESTIRLATEHVDTTGTIGIEERSWFLTPAQHRQLAHGLAPRLTAGIDEAIAALRVIKSEAEIQKLREAAAITNTAVRAAALAAIPGATERSVAAVAFSTMIMEGSEYVAMEPFVASGPRAGSIHASWTERAIQQGEGTLIELAASRGRYHAPLMHTVWTGPLKGLSARMAAACQEARDETIGILRSGNTPAQAHARCREVIDSYGLLGTYRKRSGYSVGLAFAPDWGEGHLLSLKETEHRPFQPGMVVHVVPALREARVAGFGFSSTVLVTDAEPEILTSCAFTDLAADAEVPG